MADIDEELGLETPEADRAEQVTSVISDPDESVMGGDLAVGEVLDADEADVLEQAIAVPAEEDYPAGAG